MNDRLNVVFHKFQTLVQTRSDINEHLNILAIYASQCESVLELGVRGCVSSWAFLIGLLNNNSNIKVLTMNDITECDISEIQKEGTQLGVTINYKWCNDLELEIENNKVDLVFIDTWHVYGQLKRELIKFGKIASKFIVMHDTTVDGIYGESIRCGLNVEEQSKNTGIPVEEILNGLWRAIEEYLKENPQWILEKRFTNNNGLTILKRIS